MLTKQALILFSIGVAIQLLNAQPTEPSQSRGPALNNLKSHLTDLAGKTTANTKNLVNDLMPVVKDIGDDLKDGAKEVRQNKRVAQVEGAVKPHFDSFREKTSSFLSKVRGKFVRKPTPDAELGDVSVEQPALIEAAKGVVEHAADVVDPEAAIAAAKGVADKTVEGVAEQVSPIGRGAGESVEEQVEGAKEAAEVATQTAPLNWAN